MAERSGRSRRPATYDAEIPQSVALRLQLVMVAGGEPGDRLWEIRELPSGRQTFIPVSQLEKAVATIQAKAATGDVYVGALPRLQRRGTANDVAAGWALWADLDCLEAVGRLSEFRPLPAIVIRSGSKGCCHAWWPLKSPLKPEWVPRANRRLAAALAGDPVSTDAARIMRPAGTLNFKTTPPRPVVCTRLEAQTFTLDEVIGALPDPTPPVTRRPTAPRQILRGDCLEPLVRTVRESLPGTRNARLFWAACRALEHVDVGELDSNTATDALHNAALDVGLPEFEINRTLQSATQASRRAVA